MIVHCEECGTKYQIDPDRIKGHQAKFKCKKCGYLNTITKSPKPAPAQEAERPASPPPPPPPSVPDDLATPSMNGAGTPSLNIDAAPKPKRGPKGPRLSGLFGRTRFGIELKIIIFFILPVILGFLPILATLRQMNTLSTVITTESADIMTVMARDTASEKAGRLALKIRMSLPPDLATGNATVSDGLRATLAEHIGRSGRTLVYGQEPGGNATVLLAADPALDGQPLEDVLKRLYGPAQARLTPMLKAILAGREGSGVVPSPGRDLFFAANRLGETNMAVVCAAPLEELTVPIRDLKAKADGITDFTANLSLSILAGTFILIGAIIGLFGNRLSNRIKYLTKVADRISVGELETQIRIDSKDEIGELAEAIARMQDSLRLSIERLRRRRQG